MFLSVKEEGIKMTIKQFGKFVEMLESLEVNFTSGFLYDDNDIVIRGWIDFCDHDWTINF